MRITLRNVPPALMDFLFIPCSKWETMGSQCVAGTGQRDTSCVGRCVQK